MNTVSIQRILNNLVWTFWTFFKRKGLVLFGKTIIVFKWGLVHNDQKLKSKNIQHDMVLVSTQVSIGLLYIFIHISSSCQWL